MTTEHDALEEEGSTFSIKADTLEEGIVMKQIKNIIWTRLLPDTDGMINTPGMDKHGGKWIVFDSEERIKDHAGSSGRIDKGEIESAKYWNGVPQRRQRLFPGSRPHENPADIKEARREIRAGVGIRLRLGTKPPCFPHFRLFLVLEIQDHPAKPRPGRNSPPGA